MRRNPKFITDFSLFKTELSIKIVGIYLLIFLLYVYVMNAFYSISFYITSVVLVLWAITIFLAWRIPAERLTTIRQGKMFVVGYLIVLIVLQFVMSYFYSLSPASLGQVISPYASMGTSITMQLSIEDALQNVFMIVSVSAPISFGVMGWQKFRHHQVKHTMQKGFEKYKGIRKDYDR